MDFFEEEFLKLSNDRTDVIKTDIAAFVADKAEEEFNSYSEIAKQREDEKSDLNNKISILEKKIKNYRNVKNTKLRNSFHYLEKIKTMKKQLALFKLRLKEIDDEDKEFV